MKPDMANVYPSSPLASTLVCLSDTTRHAVWHAQQTRVRGMVDAIAPASSTLPSLPILLSLSSSCAEAGEKSRCHCISTRTRSPRIDVPSQHMIHATAHR